MSAWRGALFLDSELEARRLLLKLAGVVEHLHAQGVVHRDLKPSNILFASKAHGAETLRLIDFGAGARLTGLAGTAAEPTALCWCRAAVQASPSS